MYAVIFCAETKSLDAEYAATAARLEQLAREEFGCVEFTSSTEGVREIAISYWPSLEHIEAWRKHPEHRAAQAVGKERWYAWYRVQIVEVLRTYAAPGK